MARKHVVALCRQLGKAFIAGPEPACLEEFGRRSHVRIGLFDPAFMPLALGQR